MSSKNEKSAIAPMAQSQVQTEIWWAVLNHLSAVASLGKDEHLLNAGMMPELIAALKYQSSVDLRQLSSSLTQTGMLWDINQLCRMIRLAAIPKEAQELLLLGANNKVMARYLRTSAAKCKEWREVVEVTPCFRARCVPDKNYQTVLELLDQLCEKHTPMGIPIDELLTIAQQHQVSLGAMWTELEKWDEEDEADKKKQKK
ncbi:hypothetical protein VII00023_01775 [Vibrio ichthyoenteri ATCC 700023]|uniref:Uncharacterized protein n=1 Tax=Vibrio ichthyoenteri ATCC 700023 TaxID=870968 RepID=F9S1A3_9VIBR|nr:STY4526/YPO1902 family pathogenicity island replication protein [Vibrio ichthyoenteri]EGU42038.1 hypothetical protein VII00023_01775 [Vibrio ichthyoenteri ATCC 700023]